MKRGSISWLAGGALIFVAAFFLNLSQGFSPQDESWFLQVVDRFASGEVLYRDVFFGAGPLPVYITAALAKVFGAQILVVKAVMALCFTATALVMIQICRRLSPGIHPPLLVLALLALMPPWRPGAGVPYSPMAALLLLSSLAVMLIWALAVTGSRQQLATTPTRTERLQLAAAGALAGLALATKQDVGFYCLALLVLTISVISLLDRVPTKLLFTRLRIAMAAFLATLLVALLPIFIAGGGGGYIDFGFANKGAYVSYGQLSYFTGLDQLGNNLATAFSFDAWGVTYSLFLYVMPFIVFPALALALLLVPEQRRRTAIITAYAGAGFASIFPRPDETHLAYAIPGLMVGAVWAWLLLGERLPSRGRIAIRAAVWAWLFIGLLFVADVSLFSQAGKTTTTLPHFQGVSIDAANAATLETRIETVRAMASGREQLLIVSHDAGFLYLAGGLTNPTPYDYPVATAFGRHGEEEVIASLSDGRIDAVLLDTDSSNSPMKAAALERYLIENMTPSAPNAGFILYSAKT